MQHLEFWKPKSKKGMEWHNKRKKQNKCSIPKFLTANFSNEHRQAKKQKVYSVSFLGKGGGKSKNFTSKPIIVSSNNTARIQECHIFIGHFILENVENNLLNYSSTPV